MHIFNYEKNPAMFFMQITCIYEIQTKSTSRSSKYNKRNHHDEKLEKWFDS